MWTTLALLLPLAVVPAGVDPRPAGAPALEVTAASLRLDGGPVAGDREGLRLTALHAALPQPPRPIVIDVAPQVPFDRVAAVAYTLGLAGYAGLDFGVRGPAGPAVLRTTLPRVEVGPGPSDCGAGGCWRLFSDVRGGAVHLWLGRGADGPLKVERARQPARRAPMLGKLLKKTSDRGALDGLWDAKPRAQRKRPAADRPTPKAQPVQPGPAGWCTHAPATGPGLAGPLAAFRRLDGPCTAAHLGAAKATRWGAVAQTFAALRAADLKVVLVMSDGPPPCPAPRWGQPKSDQSQ